MNFLLFRALPLAGLLALSVPAHAMSWLWFF
jgi:hypothetical protein